VSLTVDELLTYGLFHWKPKRYPLGTLRCPFVLLWLLATWSRDKRLSFFIIPGYNEMQSLQDTSLPLGVQCWQHWEQFTAQFRILKSMMFKGTVLPLTELHKGAVFGNGGNYTVKVTKFTRGTSITDKDLNNHSGIVSKEKFESYFGPFVGRAFKSLDKPNINNAHRSQLHLMGISEGVVDQILIAREQRPFKEIEDLEKRIPNLKRCHSAAFQLGSD